MNKQAAEKALTAGYLAGYMHKVADDTKVKNKDTTGKFNADYSAVEHKGGLDFTPEENKPYQNLRDSIVRDQIKKTKGKQQDNYKSIAKVPATAARTKQYQTLINAISNNPNATTHDHKDAAWLQNRKPWVKGYQHLRNNRSPIQAKESMKELFPKADFNSTDDDVNPNVLLKKLIDGGYITAQRGGPRNRSV